MIVKPRLFVKFLYYNSARQISSQNYGIAKLISSKSNCPFYKIRLLSTTTVYFNTDGESTSRGANQTISTSAVDALKNAVSKAYLMKSFDGTADRNIEKNKCLNTMKTTETYKNTRPDLLSKNGTEVSIDIQKLLGHADIKTVKKKVRVDLTVASTERNFITPARAISDFLLKPQDLESLKAIKRRSPYENDPPMTVYWRKDVEAKNGYEYNLVDRMIVRRLKQVLNSADKSDGAKDIGTLVVISFLGPLLENNNLFANKKRLKDYRKVRNSQTEIALSKTSGLFGSSGKVVLTAVAINASNFVFKLAAWIYSGSHSMFSESIHSLADTINQLILAYGIHKSVQVADEEHPYGYSNMKYVSSLISGVGIFCVGTGLSIYHGVTGLYNPAPAESFFWAFCILGGSLVSEGATLLVAINSIRKGAAEKGMTFREYVFRGQDPSVNVVLLEDLAAVLGVCVAATCMGLTSLTGSHVPDAFGSIIIGGLLGCVASFIIYTNVAALVGRSISQEFLEKINAELESDVMIRAIHDVKGIDMGNSLVRYKAELDFDGRELAKAYLDTQNIHALLEEVQQFKTIDELESFILKHSESIIDKMGAEIDRIEIKLRTKFPEIRHCDLEIL